MVVVAPDVPKVRLDAPYLGGLFQLRRILPILDWAAGGSLLHVIIGSWMASLSFN